MCTVWPSATSKSADVAVESIEQQVRDRKDGDLVKLAGRGVAVFCGSSRGNDARFVQLARDVGAALARAGATLVYGGGSIGLMGVAADAALAAGGCVLGVIPRLLATPEAAHTGLTELVLVGTMHERKTLMSERSSAYIALPGGFGTYDELIEVITWRQLQLHNKPILIINAGGFFDSLLAQAEHAIRAGFIRPEYRRLFEVVADADSAMQALAMAAEPGESREVLA